VAIALDNKLARIAWAVLKKERAFERVRARAAGSAAVRAVAADLPGG
jgi:hypothetical protein